jgi:hypothetical protein
VPDLDRQLVRVRRVRDHHRTGARLQFGKRLPVVEVAVRRHDRADRYVTDHLDQPVRLIGRVDQQGLAGARTAQQVGVVVHGTHGYLGHGQAVDVPRVGRTADTHFSGIGHLKNLIPNGAGDPRQRRRFAPAGYTPTGLEALVKILVLASKHVRELLTYTECADVMREALAGLARGQIQQPLRTVVRPRDAAGFMGLMPSYSPEAGYGLKALVITPGNPAIGKDAHQGGVLLSDVRTGSPLALINASAITEVRTAAVSAVATDLAGQPGRPNWPSSAPACRAGRTRTPSR